MQISELSVATDEHSLGSIASNNICEGGKMEGLMALCEMLKTNTTLKALMCAQSLKPNSNSA